VAGLYDPPPAGVKGKLRDQRIREYIDSHLEAHLSLQELADFLGMNIARSGRRADRLDLNYFVPERRACAPRRDPCLPLSRHRFCIVCFM